MREAHLDQSLSGSLRIEKGEVNGGLVDQGSICGIRETSEEVGEKGRRCCASAAREFRLASCRGRHRRRLAVRCVSISQSIRIQ